MNVQVNAAINILHRLLRDLRGLKPPATFTKEGQKRATAGKEEEEEEHEPHSHSEWRGGGKVDAALEYAEVYIGH